MPSFGPLNVTDVTSLNAVGSGRALAMAVEGTRFFTGRAPQEKEWIKAWGNDYSAFSSSA
jgi:hypothetical protein